MVLVALSDRELDEEALSKLENSSAFQPDNKLEFKDIAVIGSEVAQRTSRGLSGIQSSPKRPVTAEFEAMLRDTFDAHYGLAFPHQ
jgi:hypothetical protein